MIAIMTADSRSSHNRRVIETPVGIRAAELAMRIGAQLYGDGDVMVAGIEQDSRRVTGGALFVALRGAHVDGIRFAPSAIARGAAAVLCEHGRAGELADQGVPVLEVSEPRAALARAAALIYDEPTRKLTVVGITGTNGKTTTAHLCEAALVACKHRPGIIGTLGHRFESTALGEGFTSPEADELQRIAASMVASGASHLVMEVSSIALAADRVAEVRFEVAAFTNLTQDHLDYHGSMAAYAAAKDRLFFDWCPRVSVVNIDDPHGAELARRVRAAGRQVISVSVDPSSPADLRPDHIDASSEGTTLSLHGGGALQSPLIGRYNASNLLVAVGIARGLGLDERAIVGIGGMRTVAGRLERCDDPRADDIVAVVDYAHTPDALERVLANVRGLTQGKLWCVFGCGGDRDPAKRAPMGEAVARAADVAIVTNDNPRSERPEDIASAVLVGVARAGANSRHVVELDRHNAIDMAVNEAEPGDVVLVAGKGHEPYQIIGDRVLSFDDRDELRAALAKRRARIAAATAAQGGG
jgi:UDP-N-acetylmuramoyl-L-alanyl-D-glutamate--2,6-diaminopimelate ligase